MGKTILTPKQSDFLELAASEPQITKRFYLTGGTALAEFYLKHRISEDIDLFCEEKEVEPKAVEAFLQKIAHKIGVAEIKRSQFLGLFSYVLIYHDGEKLKVDFNYYPFLRIDKGTKYKELQVNSIYDIAVDKLHTLFMKPRARDYIDLYFIFESANTPTPRSRGERMRKDDRTRARKSRASALEEDVIMKEKNYSLEKLISDAKIKFDWHIDKTNLASQFLRVGEQADFPRMLVPFERKEMEDFFLKLAKSLEGDIFE